MQLEDEAFERFINAFAERYEEELKYVGLVSEEELLQLFFEFRESDKTPEEWFEQQELS